MPPNQPLDVALCHTPPSDGAWLVGKISQQPLSGRTDVRDGRYTCTIPMQEAGIEATSVVQELIEAAATLSLAVIEWSDAVLVRGLAGLIGSHSLRRAARWQARLGQSRRQRNASHGRDNPSRFRVNSNARGSRGGCT